MKTRLKSHMDGTFTIQYKYGPFWRTYQEEIVPPYPFYNFYREYRTSFLEEAVTTMLILEDKLNG